MDSKSLKVYETEAFTRLIHGSHLFRYSSSADNASSLEKRKNEAAETDGTSAVTERTEPSDSKVTVTHTVTDDGDTASLQEIPMEVNKTSNFIDRRIGTVDPKQDRTSKQKESRQIELEQRLTALSVREHENGAVSRLDESKAACNEKKAEGTIRSCQTCGEDFADSAAQRRHYQLDWHRCNLHRALRGRQPVTEEQFAELVDADDVSSISGSESEPSEGESSPEASTNEGEAGVGPESQRHSRVYFETADRRVFSLHRCLLHSKKESVSEEQLLSACHALPANTRWAVILAGGGHFAAAIFHGGEVALRKTFHTYTVRRGQGTAQGVRDSRGNAPKSAGAALRRRNELTLQQDVQALLESWRDALAAVSLVFVRASPTQRAALFGGRRAALGQRDPRLRSLPFPTRRATLAECKRAHDLLASVLRHGPTQAYQRLLRAATTPIVTAKPPTPRASNRDASREPRQRPQPTVSSSESSDDDQDAGPELQTELTNLDTSGLREFQCNPRRKRKPRRGKRGAGKAAPAQGEEAAQTTTTPAQGSTTPVQGSTPAMEGVSSKVETAQPAKDDEDQGPGAETQEGDSTSRTEGKAAARRQRKERLRERRAEEERLREEQDERQRFMLLSDREKRALAAERRLASAGTSTALARCHLCGVDMTGQVPFCYLDMRFCSVPCLQSHRRANV